MSVIEKGVSRASVRMAPRYVGTLDGDLAVLSITIKHAIVHNAGEVFLVWADADGMVFVAPDNTRHAQRIAELHAGWVVNTYRSRWEIQGVRIPLEPKHIAEDLAFHRDERALA